MQIVLGGLIFAGLVPIGFAVWANRGTSLLHALGWALVAWFSWGIAFVVGDADKTEMDPARYGALCLTGCVGVAVLGARRPHVFAWNFVVLGLLAVMLLPLLETLFIGTHPVDGLRISFLAGTLAVGILNYLPTRIAPAAILSLIVGTGEIALLYAPSMFVGFDAPLIFDLLLTSVPWIGWICWARRSSRCEFDRHWRSFRDRWGMVWSQRVREQFNHACRHAGLPVHLAWRGLRSSTGDSEIGRDDEAKALAILQANLQRFLGCD